MKTYRFILLVLLCYCLPVTMACAQEVPDTSNIYRIEMVNENVYIGNIISRDTEIIVFETQDLGIVNLPVNRIKKIEVIQKGRIIKGEYWFENPQATRYFWAPNGYGLREGEGYYQNVWVFFNQISFGITDEVSLGIGVLPLFLIGGGPTPVWITPKVSIPISQKVHVGGGALIGTIIGEDTGGAFGIAYGTSTFGTRDKNLSVGLGYGFADGDWSRVPTINVSAMIRTGKRGYFLTENYLIGAGDETLALLSAGGRRVGKVSLDYGVIVPLALDLDSFVAIPWLGISVTLGKKD